MRFAALFIFISTAKLAIMDNEDKLYDLMTRMALEEANSTMGNEVYENPSGSTRRYMKFTPTAEQIGMASNINLRAFELLTKKMQVPKGRAIKLLNRRLPKFCRQEEIECRKGNKYRSIQGICNNFDHPYWGSSYTPFNRFFPPTYNDGYNEPRGGRERSKLPNSRLISSTIHTELVAPDGRFTNMVPQIGQFLDHDMTLTPELDKPCCKGSKNEDCWPISVFKNDAFFGERKVNCLDFTRSIAYCFPSLSGQREQMNILTAFVDASHVYGSEESRAIQLREFSKGKLRVNKEMPKLLPYVKEVERAMREKIEFMGDFLAGDERVNEMPALTSMHTLLVREHNRLAGEIYAQRPEWNDEKIYQEARRILIAEWQNVIYSEYLPIILGEETMKKYNLTITSTFSQYQSNVDPTIFHSFATAAYRFGHTLINGLIKLMRGLSPVGSYRIRDNFFNAEQILRERGEGYELILGGLMTQNTQTYDSFVTEDLTNFLLKEKENDFGSDLIARNLQRGRDHGLQPYDKYRELCGLGKLSTWFEGPPEIPGTIWRKLQLVYSTPADIDLFTGGLSETSKEGAISGPTFNCLKGIQFANVKFGDRFFFTHGGEAGSFSGIQMEALRGRTLDQIICDNSDLQMTTSNVFIAPSNSNPWVFCSEKKNLNISLFL